jgi:putative transposase
MRWQVSLLSHGSGALSALRSARRVSYPTRDAARHDVFEYIEMFNNPKRKHTNNGMLSPVDFEARQQKLNQAGV